MARIDRRGHVGGQVPLYEGDRYDYRWTGAPEPAVVRLEGAGPRPSGGLPSVRARQQQAEVREHSPVIRCC
jgi:hypothetical protein